MQTVWGKPLIDVADLHTSLKDGVVLCEYFIFPSIAKALI